MEPEMRKALEDQRKLLVLVWSGFISALVIYLLIPQFISVSELSPGPGSFSDILRTPLWIVALAEFGVLWWWNNRFLTKEAVLKEMTVLQKLSENQAVSSYAGKKIVAFALAESIAIYGLVLALIGNHLSDQYLMTLIAGLWLVYLYPSGAFFEDLAREFEARGAG